MSFLGSLSTELSYLSRNMTDDSLPLYPGSNKVVTFFYATTPETADQFICAHFLDVLSVALDVEWPQERHGAGTGVAVIQIASSSTVLVAQISAMSGVPSMLRAILQNPAISKVGVAIENDTLKLTAANIAVHNWIDLVKVAIAISPVPWTITFEAAARRGPNADNTRVQAPGLAKLVRFFLGRIFTKDKEVAKSNWAQPLTQLQQSYAAYDALAVAELFAVMVLYASDDVVDACRTSSA